MSCATKVCGMSDGPIQVNPQAFLHYAGLAIPVSRDDVKNLLGAISSVTRGVSQSVLLEDGWTIVIGPGIPAALHTPPPGATQVSNFGI